MNTKLKILPLLLGAILFFSQCDKDANNPDLDQLSGSKKDLRTCTVVQQLWAGAGKNDISKGTLVGNVTADLNGNILVVKYETTAPWGLTEAHVWVGNSLLQVPNKAAPGLFPFKQEGLAYLGEATFTINLSDHGIDPEQDIFIAAHGVVGTPDGVEGIGKLLPENISFKVLYRPALYNFKTTVLPPSFLAGEYIGWCIETGVHIGDNEPIPATAYSSYDPANCYSGVGYPNAMNMLNWLINQNLIGQTISIDCGGEVKTFTINNKDIQLLIWKIFDQPESLSTKPEPDRLCLYDKLFADVSAHTDFVPECGQKMAVILCTDAKVQKTFIEYPVPCGEDETAWAYGEYTFIDLKIAKNWGWIFEMCNN